MELKVGLILLNYNDSVRTIDYVNRVYKYNSITNIVVVDNCSTDNSLELFRQQLADKCDVIKSEYNGGYAYGNNFGMKYLKRKYNLDIFVISNPDVIIKENIIIEFRSAFKHTDYGAVSGIMKDTHGNMDYRTYWNIKTYWDDIQDCVCLLRWIKRMKNPTIIDKSKKIMTVEVIHGSFFAIKSDVINAIDYLDEDTFLYYEEDILAKKLNNLNYKVGILTNVEFIHAHKISKHIISDHKRYLRSKWIYEIKYNRINLLKKLILKIALFYSYMETIILILVKFIINKVMIKAKGGGRY